MKAEFEKETRGTYPIWAARSAYELAMVRWIESLARLLAEVNQGHFETACRDQESVDRAAIYAIESVRAWVRAVSSPRWRSRAQSAALRALK